LQQEIATRERHSDMSVVPIDRVLPARLRLVR